jgi:hypothetical protein
LIQESDFLSIAPLKKCKERVDLDSMKVFAKTIKEEK